MASSSTSSEIQLSLSPQEAHFLKKGAMQATCKTCDGSQVIDSGGFTPWGEGINIACPECLSREEMCAKKDA